MRRWGREGSDIFENSDLKRKRDWFGRRWTMKDGKIIHDQGWSILRSLE